MTADLDAALNEAIKDRDWHSDRLDAALGAIRGLLAEPYGCRFCDSGTLRKPNDPAKDHDSDCPYAVAHAALSKAGSR